MSSPARIAANRRNAQKSTGPITVAGRNRTRLNALRHGITRQVTVMTDDERAGFMEYCAEIVAGFAPANAHERRLAQAIAEDYWRLDRSRAAEHNLFARALADNEARNDAEAIAETETGDPSDPALIVDDPRVQAAFVHARVTFDEVDRLNLLSLYEQRLSRSLHKNVALLRDIQAERRTDESHALELALKLREREVEAPRIRAIAAGSRQLPETEALTLNGFAFANPDLAHELDRRERYRNPRPTRRGPSQSLKSAA